MQVTINDGLQSRKLFAYPGKSHRKLLAFPFIHENLFEFDCDSTHAVTKLFVQPFREITAFEFHIPADVEVVAVNLPLQHLGLHVFDQLAPDLHIDVAGANVDIRIVKRIVEGLICSRAVMVVTVHSSTTTCPNSSMLNLTKDFNSLYAKS